MIDITRHFEGYFIESLFEYKSNLCDALLKYIKYYPIVIHKKQYVF